MHGDDGCDDGRDVARKRTPERPLSTPTRNAPSTFVFADLAGWTALTEAHGDADALRIVEEFETRVRALLTEHRAEEVKTIGDAVMIRVSDARDAVKLGLDISRRLSAHRSPPVRVGMNTGPALEREGDWFGATVNLASRVAAEARPAEVLLTEATREALSDQQDFELQAGGSRQLRHIADLVPVFRAVEPGNPERTFDIDPVCRMAVDPAHAAATQRRFGMTRYFCSPECATAFDTSPRRYLATSRAARAARTGLLINLAAFLVVGSTHLVSWLIRGHPGGFPPLVLVFIAWAAVLVIHFRIVRPAL